MEAWAAQLAAMKTPWELVCDLWSDYSEGAFRSKKAVQ